MNEPFATEIFELLPVWNAAGDSEYHLVDSADGLLDVDCLLTTTALAAEWVVPILEIVADRRSADIYFCPGGAYLFSSRARATVEPFLARDAEWLPVAIRGLGVHFALHPLRQVPLAAASKYRVNEISGNIVEIFECRFERQALGSSSVFYAAQAPGSAAAEGGLAYPSMFVTGLVGNVISSKLSGLKVVPRIVQ